MEIIHIYINIFSYVILIIASIAMSVYFLSGLLDRDVVMLKIGFVLLLINALMFLIIILWK
ncbi:hypothetical protein MWQ88_002443 [Staphylococcus pseudintermedius]|uniref:hypothetical protein n=1 Tax=Staphylococcus pseudintermedius TaxID=283734 RepID=UPI000C1C5D8D|nr:hypothetical protein [Staphylococcus pseudintermedius]EGQ1688824.1 hypothetical protein [Staphylococcus pseudintermedius]EGQ1767769.1 hypothetical protein [Staphylococcus pseudintermedius]EGQ2686354.1 hypothetical protein [Staphylococcus pseudintermedius]EGQ2911246.1 hypothetical protein [Staphylococcus pseudintermedius]EGQ2927532.1 hypothetical protein [Staphylococcus pseudintermedius]